MTLTRALSLLALVVSCTPPELDPPNPVEDGSTLRRPDAGQRDAGTSTSTDAGTTNVSKPNILLIIADDLGIDSSPCYTIGTSNLRPTMPNLSALCEKGVVFDNFWAKTECSPTRASLMTGQYNFRTNVGAASDTLATTFPTLQQALAGVAPAYSNALIGKWHLGGGTVSIPQTRALGVQYYQGIWIGALMDYYNWSQTLSDGGTKSWSGAPSDAGSYATTVITEDAKNWLKTAPQPWFLWLAYNAPHTPFHLPPPGMYTNTSLSGSAMDLRVNSRAYFIAALEALDHEMGRVLESLDETTRASTLIVFMGDNGTTGQVVQSPWTNATAKATIYEGGIHTPLVISGANVSRQGVHETGLVQMEDLTATLAQIAGATVSGDGVSFMGALTAANATSRSVAYSEFFRGNGSNTMGDDPDEFGWTTRNSQYQFVHKTNGTRQLFDLTTDPGDTTDLLAGGGTTDHQSIANDLDDAGSWIRSH